MVKVSFNLGHFEILRVWPHRRLEKKIYSLRSTNYSRYVFFVPIIRWRTGGMAETLRKKLWERIAHGKVSYQRDEKSFIFFENLENREKNFVSPITRPESL